MSEGTFYVITFCVRKSFGKQFEWYKKLSFSDWLTIKDMLVFAFNLFNLLLRWVEKVGKFDLLFPSAFLDEF